MLAVLLSDVNRRILPRRFRMRGLGVALALCGHAAAHADPPASPLTPGETSFWEWLAAPHAADIAMVLAKAGQSLTDAVENAAYRLWDYNGALNRSGLENRRRLLDEAEGMLQYAVRLDPNNADVYRQLGYIADEKGDTETARRALEMYMARERSDRVTPEARFRLGRAYARQAKWDEAIMHLLLALGSETLDYAGHPATIRTLACVYMNLGRVGEAIDLLRHSVDIRAGHPYLISAPPQLQFTLAVAYDRDEQISRAYDVLNGLTTGHQTQSLLTVLQDSNNQQPEFAPAIDRYYFSALQLEAMGYLLEARREWSSYERAPGARFRDRARDHIAKIDALLRRRYKSQPRSAQ